MIETLEENQVQLQSMMASKFIGHFRQEISEWQRTLGTVDHVVSLWFDVQRTWSHLESIFVGSDDIRQQLPVDSERFDETNDRFLGMLKEITRIARDAPEDKIVVVSQFTSFLSVLQPLLQEKNFSFTRLDGAMSHQVSLCLR